MVLKHHCALWAGLGHFFAIEQGGTLGRHQQTGHDVQHGGFTTTGVADQ